MSMACWWCGTIMPKKWTSTSLWPASPSEEVVEVSGENAARIDGPANVSASASTAISATAIHSGFLLGRISSSSGSCVACT